MEIPQISSAIGGVLSIIAGILLIIWPRIVGWVIGIYLIIVGILTILPAIRTGDLSLLP